VNYYEDHHLWVKRDDPNYVVCIRSVDWGPSMAEFRLGVQHYAPNGSESHQTFLAGDFHRKFIEFTPPGSKISPNDRYGWWREKGRRVVAQIHEVVPWRGPTLPVSVVFYVGETMCMMPEDLFLERFEPGNPPPDTRTIWGKIWADD